MGMVEPPFTADLNTVFSIGLPLPLHSKGFYHLEESPLTAPLTLSDAHEGTVSIGWDIGVGIGVPLGLSGILAGRIKGLGPVL